nr:hypothetical protein StreXyl84_75050 [Streptomyces sp. Xyl84]
MGGRGKYGAAMAVRWLLRRTADGTDDRDGAGAAHVVSAGRTGAAGPAKHALTQQGRVRMAP